MEPSVRGAVRPAFGSAAEAFGACATAPELGQSAAAGGPALSEAEDTGGRSSGTTRSVLTEAGGIPIGLAIAGAKLLVS
jgi:hypothetical protein